MEVTMEILQIQTPLKVNDYKNMRLFIFEDALSVRTHNENAWFIDSGASVHMSCKRERFDEYNEKHDGTHIYLGDNRSHQV